MVLLFTQFSTWQFDRSSERSQFNADMASAMRAEPIDLSTNASAASSRDLNEWTPVLATGRFAQVADVLVRRRTQEGSTGFLVLTPFVTTRGEALLVNRGWVQAPGAATALPEVPPPSNDRTQITGFWRLAESGSEPIPADVPDRQVLRIDPVQISREFPELGVFTTNGYLHLTYVDAEPPSPMRPAAIPALQSGPHLGYAVQWAVFALFAIAGWIILFRRDLRSNS